ncbi:MAG TPA: type IV pilus secretin PilQ [Candidatus Acidoferrales bacterium]|nr:type IV pilus secretin PilQ [Candidatus Acidoferrales bacterium]
MKTFRPALESVFSARRLAMLALAGATAFASALAAGPAVSLPALRVNAQVTPQAVRIEAQSTGAFTYTSTRPNERTLVIEIPGVTPSGEQDAKALESGIVAGYRMVPFGDGSAAGVKLQVLLTSPSEPRFERTGPQQLAIVFDNHAAIAPVANRPSTAVLHGNSRISKVEVTEENEQPILRVMAQGELHYHTSRLAHPDRLVIDFADASVSPEALVPTESLDPVDSVRIGQFQPDVARVVVNLDRWTPFTVVTANNGLAVTFDSRANRLDESGTKMLQARSASAKAADKPNTKLPLPAWLTQSSSALASPAQQVSPAMPQENQAAPKQDASMQNTNPASTPAQETQAAPTPAASPRYSGEPISVNFKDVDLKDFFRLIHEISGLNVVLDPAVRGNLTLVLDRVPWDQALDLVLKNNNLDKQLDGNVLRIATQETIKSEAQMRADLQKAQELAVERVTVTRQLSYAKVVPTGAGGGGQAKPLEQILKPFLSPRGDIVADPRTNTLIIRDIPSVIPAIDSVIRQVDKKTPQVEIEARIVQASRNFARDLGVQIAAAGITGSNFIGGAPQTTAGSSSPASVTPVFPVPFSTGSTGSLPFISNLPTTAQGATSGLSFVHQGANFALDAILTAAETRGLAKVISRPKVVTQTNFKGSVKQGAQIPIQTTINNTVSTQFIDAELKLEVTPQITADGTISMDVHLENTSADFANEVLGQPSLDTQEVQNQVIVRDGETVMLGGVYVSNQNTTVNQVPVLGSLPVIGHLFKEQSVSVKTSELIFFLTPHISNDN